MALPWPRVFPCLVLLMSVLLSLPVRSEVPDEWRAQWPHTDFSRATVPLREIMSGGPGKDGIPSIDEPVLVPLAQYREIDELEPVIGLIIDDEARAYPLRVLIWHEIVNDIVAGIPVAITYCPLCNTSIVFDRRLGGQVLEFGTSGNLRHSDLVMYDRQTESWWQQFGGESIVGRMAGQSLQVIPSRLESITEFRARAPGGRVLVPADPSQRDYTQNPYAGYDSAALPFLFGGRLPGSLPAMARVVAIDDLAVSLTWLREQGSISVDGLLVSWQAGQRSALDAAEVAGGRDVGSVTVSREGREVAYVVTFAFAFFAFHPAGMVITAEGRVGRD